MESHEVLQLEQFNCLFTHQDAERSKSTSTAGKAIEDVERDLIYSTLEKMGGNKTKAAELLKITTRTLRNKLHKYNAESKPVLERETVSCAE